MNEEAGHFAQRAQPTRLARFSLGYSRFSLFVLGALGALAISMPIEGGLSWVSIRRSIIVVLLFGILWTGRWWARRPVRKRVTEIGSFFYVTCLEESGNDRLAATFERALAFHIELWSAGVALEQPVVHESIGVDPAGRSPKQQVEQLVTNFVFAVKRDAANTPTNLLLNMDWPMGLAFGAELVERSSRAGSKLPERLRVWYAPDQVGLTSAKMLGGALVDVCDVELAARHSHEDSASEPPVEAPGTDERGVLVVHHTAAPWDLDGLNGSAEALGFGSARWFGPLIERSEFEPKEMHAAAAEAADRIEAVLHAVSGKVLLFARLSPIEPFLIGSMLAQRGADWRRLTMAVWSGERFEPWSFEPEQVTELPHDAELVNLMPHWFHLFSEDGVELLTLAPSDQPARVEERLGQATPVDVNGCVEVRTFKVAHGRVVDLPAPVPGRVFIASRITAMAAVGRHDVMFPLDEVRDEHGTVIGCRSLGRFG